MDEPASLSHTKPKYAVSQWLDTSRERAWSIWPGCTARGNGVLSVNTSGPFRLHSGPRWNVNPGVHPKPGTGGHAPGSNESVAL